MPGGNNARDPRPEALLVNTTLAPAESRETVRSKFAWTFAVLAVVALAIDAIGPIRAWPKLAFMTAFTVYNALDPTATFGRRFFWTAVWLVWMGFFVYGVVTCCDHCCGIG